MATERVTLDVNQGWSYLMLDGEKLFGWDDTPTQSMCDKLNAAFGEGAAVELPESLRKGMSELSLTPGEIQIDLRNMPAGSFPPEFLKSLGVKRFRATLDVAIIRIETLERVMPLESARLLATGRVSLGELPPA